MISDIKSKRSARNKLDLSKAALSVLSDLRYTTLHEHGAKDQRGTERERAASEG